tara:strand:+ start:51 stop:467 length:417 start_codon:yes stop_codon:yes gene_type:complete
MKKFTILMTFFLATLITGSAFADITNPVTRAKVGQFIEVSSGPIFFLEACDSELYIPLYENALEMTYLLAKVKDSLDEDLVNMMWPTQVWQLSEQNQEYYNFMKNFPEHADTIETCAAMEIEAADMLEIFKTQIARIK